MTTFQRILRDPRTQNIPLILSTNHYDQPNMIWRTEIEILQYLANTPPEEDEDLDFLVDELKRVIKRGKTLTTKAKRKRENILRLKNERKLRNRLAETHEADPDLDTF
jgi:response regulator RpfG family c-di-GMP phosphodiesterase